MPLWTEVMVQAGHSEIRGIGNRDVALVSYFVDAVAPRAGKRAGKSSSCTRWVIPDGLELVPHLLNERIYSQASWIARDVPIRAAVGPSIQVVLNRIPVGIGER